MAGYKGSAVVRRAASDGAQGPAGPLLVFRGEYDSNAIYYGNASRIDAVKYNGQAYKTLITSGTFQGVVPTNTAKWVIFPEQFDAVATKLLLADTAAIQNLIAEQLKTAISGKRIEINAGDKQQVAIYDASNALKVLVKPEPVSSRTAIEAGASSASFSPTSSEMGSQDRNWSHPNFGTWQGTQVSAQFETTIDGVLEIEISNIQVSAYVYEGSYARGMANITVVLQKYNGSAWIDVGTIGETNETVGTRNISATIRGLSAGIYRLAALHSHMSYTEWQGYEQISDSVQTSSDWSYQSGSSITVTVRKVIAQTEIGTDGIASVWASNVYMHFSQNGLFVKMGSITFEVSSSGVKINGVTHS